MDEEFQMDNLDTGAVKISMSQQVFQDSAVALPPLNPNLARKMLQEMARVQLTHKIPWEIWEIPAKLGALNENVVYP